MGENKVVSASEFKKHDKEWLIINGYVYDVSKFAMLHPGGEKLLLSFCGKDATDVFYGLHKHEVIAKYQSKLLVGVMEGSEPMEIQTRADICTIPYCEPSFFTGQISAYWTEDHIRFRAEVRKWLHVNIYEEAEAGELSNTPPSKELLQKMGSVGILAARLGPGKHLESFSPIFGVDWKEFTYFHEAIVHEEISRIGAPGFVDGLGSGVQISMPAIHQFANDELKARVSKEVLSGEKRSCLAITEPTTGSDVAAISTTATLSADGSHYIVNGVKKWITQGADADYFLTLCRTGDSMSMLLIERGEGVETKRIKTSYATAAGTSLVIFEDVKVPASNLVGFEGAGFIQAMYNFNHERWFICALILAGARGVVTESLLWANQRVAFGKPLIQQPVIRQKLAHMISELEACYCWFENITYQMTQMSYEEQSMKLAGTTSLLKLRCTRMAHNLADEAVQIFGGRGITQTGMGKNIERFHKTYKFAAILGGSEEIMADLGVKMMMKQIPSNAKL